MQPTQPLYLRDAECCECDARVLGARADAIALDRSCFYPGGGGQPCDRGTLHLADRSVLAVSRIERDESDVIWHIVDRVPDAVVDAPVRAIVDARQRRAFSRHHTVLHVLNTIAMRQYEGWITGVQIGSDYSRIDFKLEQLSPALCADLEARVNAVTQDDRPVRARMIGEDEFRARDDLLRTLEVRPPVVDGRVRIVEIEGFDAQACGGTHVRSTAAIGRLSIYRTENKGRVNKRLYVRLHGHGDEGN